LHVTTDSAVRVQTAVDALLADLVDFGATAAAAT
jgi:hypothetical protein